MGYFFSAPAGTGKTFVLSTIAAYARSKKKICLTAAFSGVAAQLLDGGMTIHKRYGMVGNMPPDAPCKFSNSNAKGKLIKDAQVLLLDEVAMMSKIDLHRIDDSIRDLMGPGYANIPFGGKVVVMGGDFRQILP